MSYKQKHSKSNELLRYAGLGAQIFVSLGIAVFAGLKSDKWMKIPFPLFVWLFPFIVLVIMIYKLIKDTSKPKQ